MPAASESIAIDSGSGFVEEACGVRDVWAYNLEDEFKIIRQIVQSYKYIVMDTKFPGTINQPIVEFQHSTYPYQLLKYNVDFLKIIQLDLKILDVNGTPPPGLTKWRFNFKLNLTDDLYGKNCIELLTSSGFHYLKHEEDGIDSYEFAELLMTSGVVLCDNVNWISFHSGYDFGYLLKLLTDKNLPAEESEFLDLLRVYFPTIIKSSKNLKVGLQDVLKHSYLTSLNQFYGSMALAQQMENY